MTQTEDKVAAHYTTGDILGRIREGLSALGVNPDAPTVDSLKPVDEFHTGGLEATQALLEQVEITPPTRVLDIGCGLGGTARFIASHFGAHVTGIDLTPAYVDVANKLSEMVELDGKTMFLQASALKLPFEDDSFDMAVMLHVGMNIEDKSTMFSEAARVLAPGGIFALFDIMRGDDAKSALRFPFPWAEVAEASFVAPPQSYRDAAAAAGFEQTGERDRSDFGAAFFKKVFAANAERGGPPPVGIHLLMRETAGEKLKNYVAALESGQLAPHEMIFKLRG